MRQARLSRSQVENLAWAGTLLLACLFPFISSVRYLLTVGILALLFVILAVAFDLVAGRVGALSLAQPLFFGLGAYGGALMSAAFATNFVIESLVMVLAASVLAVLVAIPSFRLSLHSFAIATLGFAICGQLIARNWIDVTGGPLCVKGQIGPLVIPTLGGEFIAASLTSQYFVILAIAVLTVAGVRSLMKRRAGLFFTAVRDDATLAAMRGAWPNGYRILAFTISAAITSVAGVFSAHFLTVVCPDSLDFSYTVALLIIVFVGGRASLRGVVAGAVLFTAVPEVLRLTEEWRLVIYGGFLLVVVVMFPDGLEQLFQLIDHSLGRVTRRMAGSDDGADGAAVHR